MPKGDGNQVAELWAGATVMEADLSAISLLLTLLSSPFISLTKYCGDIFSALRICRRGVVLLRRLMAVRRPTEALQPALCWTLADGLSSPGWNRTSGVCCATTASWQAGASDFCPPGRAKRGWSSCLLTRLIRHS